MRRRDAGTQEACHPAGCATGGCQQNYRDNCAAIGTTRQGGSQDIACQATRGAWLVTPTELVLPGGAAIPCQVNCHSPGTHLLCGRRFNLFQLLSLHTTLPDGQRHLLPPLGI